MVQIVYCDLLSLFLRGILEKWNVGKMEYWKTGKMENLECWKTEY